MATVVQTRAYSDANQAFGAFTPTSPFTVGNHVTVLFGLEADPGNIPLGVVALIGGEAMTLVDEAADESTGVGLPNTVWSLHQRVIDGTEASDDITFDLGGAVSGVAGLVEASGAVSVAGSIQSMDSSTVDGLLPDTYQVLGTFSADLNLHLYVGHYLSSAALSWTSAGLSNTSQAIEGGSGDRVRTLVGTSLSSTNPSETISGTVGASYSAPFEARAACVALTYTGASTPAPMESIRRPIRRHVSVTELPYQLTDNKLNRGRLDARR